PGKTGKGERPCPADRVGPEMEMDFAVGGPEARLVETGLEQGQRQCDGDYSRADPEMLVRIAIAGAGRAPGDPGHDQSGKEGENRRGAPAARLESKGQRNRAEEDKSRRGH